jgi:hypothetical protein
MPPTVCDAGAGDAEPPGPVAHQQQQQQQQPRPGAQSQRRLTQLAFSARSPHLAGLLSPPGGGGGDALVVWDLLTLSVAWSCSLPACVSLSADPSAALFAVAFNHSISKAPQGQQTDQPPQPQQQQTDQQQQQQQQAPGPEDLQSRAARRTQRRGTVLLFSPSSPAPVMASVLPLGTAVAAALHVPPRTPLGAAATAGGGGCSGATPLLALTEDRSYTLIAQPGTGGTAAVAAPLALTEAGPIGGADESVLEAVFGKPAAAHAARGAAGGGGVHDARAAARQVAALFDAPSHALPPPSRLCTSLLEVLLEK